MVHQMERMIGKKKMKKIECKRLIERNDRCHCKGIWEIVEETWADGETYYYLRCNKCWITFE